MLKNLSIGHHQKSYSANEPLHLKITH